jgi:mono/diheme cytochrome c family protein
LQTPFGELLGPNLTPDVATGIGAWTDDEFINALLNGIGRGGEHLYPGMPYTYYTKMSREDALAIRAYLATIAPVHNRVQPNQLPFPFDVRAGLVGWDKLYFTKGRFEPVSQKSAEWNRGAYLVQGLGHCGMCHTPKSALGGDESSRALQGGEVQGWFAPNITGDVRLGLGGWSVGDIVAYLHDGHNAKSAAIGGMAEVVGDSTSHLRDADLQAIAVYLNDQHSGNADAQPSQPVAQDDPVMRAGEAVYLDNCAACHTGDGRGIPKLFPPLSGNSSVQQTSALDLIKVVLSGTDSAATDGAPTALAMPSFAWKLSDAQVAAALSYIRNSWGNRASIVTSGDVAALRKSHNH